MSSPVETVVETDETRLLRRQRGFEPVRVHDVFRQAALADEGRMRAYLLPVKGSYGRREASK